MLVTVEYYLDAAVSEQLHEMPKEGDRRPRALSSAKNSANPPRTRSLPLFEFRNPVLAQVPHARVTGVVRLSSSERWRWFLWLA